MSYEDRQKNDFQDTREMRGDRAKLLDEARDLLDKPRNTAHEREQARQKTTEARELGEQIDKAELHNENMRSAAGEKLARLDGTAASGRSFRDQETGDEVRAIRHGESFRTAVGASTPSMSMGKLVYGAATGNWKGASAERTAYGQTSDVGGGYLLNPAMSALVVDLARAKSVVSAAGAITVPMATEELKIALVAEDPTAYWTGENSEITQSNGTFKLLTLRAKCLAVYCTASLELIRNASNAQGIIEHTISQAIATALDAAALAGTGATQPVGLRNSDFVTAYDAAGAITYDKMLSGAQVLWNNNVEPQSMLYDADMRSAIAKQKDGEGLYMAPPPEIAKLSGHMSTAISSTDSNNCLFIGDFQNAIFGIRNQVEIEVSGVADDVFRKKQVAIRGLVWADFAVARDGDIVRIGGVTGT